MPETVVSQYKSFAFTHVMYPRGDPLGKCLAMASLLPQTLVVVVLTALFVGTPPCRAVAGRVVIVLAVMEVVNSVLKNAIREPRPFHPELPYGDRDYGMPSSHAQFSVALAAQFIAATYSAKCYRPYARSAGAMVAVAVAAVVCWSRVYLLYHTVEQVVAGALLGAVTSAALLFPGLLDRPGRAVTAAAQWAVGFLVRDTK